MARNDELAELMRLTNGLSQPNLNPLFLKVRQLDAMALTVKYFGYELARTLADALPKGAPPPPRYVGLLSKPSTQTDLESDWVSHWCDALKIPVVFHRKIWELCYVLQAIYENGLMKPGAKGLGFGCGEEPLPSLFASKQMQIVVTDLDPGSPGSAGWTSSGQHTSHLEKAHRPHLVSKEVFVEHCSLRHVDMNQIPSDLVEFDFCWSICALEHLGSIERGLKFIENSVKTVRSGGIAVHTTEFNFFNENETIDNWPTVLFQRKHFLEVYKRLTALGYSVAPLDFNVGNKPLDRFIDVPPWSHDQPAHVTEVWGNSAPHIKLSIDGFPSTCFGLIIKK